MSELLKLRDNYLCFSGIFHLDQLDIATVIGYVATVQAINCLAVCILYVGLLLYINNNNNNNNRSLSE